jgi:phosphatidylglycerol:prolipoprotein diacylglycerol transferase
MVLIIMVLYTKHRKFDGEVFLIYLLGYGAGRVWIEGLRTDQLLLPVVGLPVSQLLAGVLIAVSLAFIVIVRMKQKKQ